MAININSVYQKVLALANKEQRGYITPQEFNLFADQAQLEIFHSYFKDLTRAQFDQTKTDDYVDSVDILEEKLDVHRVSSINSLSLVSGNKYSVSSDVYLIDSIVLSYTVNGVSISSEAEKVSHRDTIAFEKNKLLQASADRPNFCRENDGNILISPTSPSVITTTFFKKPATPKWTYVVVNNKALYNSSAGDAQNFDLHDSEENNLVMRILELSGITIKDGSLNQVAMRDRLNTKAQENN
mgnify:CR=1 FL=1